MERGKSQKLPKSTDSIEHIGTSIFRDSDFRFDVRIPKFRIVVEDGHKNALKFPDLKEKSFFVSINAKQELCKQ